MDWQNERAGHFIGSRAASDLLLLEFFHLPQSHRYIQHGRFLFHQRLHCDANSPHWNSVRRLTLYPQTYHTVNTSLMHMATSMQQILFQYGMGIMDQYRPIECVSWAFALVLADFIWLHDSLCRFQGIPQEICNQPQGGVFTLYWLSIQVMLALTWKLTGEFRLSTLYLPFFAAGIGCCWFKKETLLENMHLASLSFLIVCIVTCFWTSGATSPMNILYKIIVTFAMIQLTYIGCKHFVWNSTVDSYIQRCGRCSLAIYVLHWSFLSLEPYHPFLPQNEWAALLLTSIFGMIVALVCCWIYDFLRPLPWIRLFLFGQTKFSK